MYTLYHIKNIVNGHIYVGQTRQKFYIRRWQHKNALNKSQHKNPKLQNAWNKYGASNFLFEIIKTTNSFDEINRLEIEEIKRVGYYNLDPGGMNPSIRSAETLLKISKAHKGKTIPPSMRKHLSEVNTGSKNPRCKLSEEQIYYIKFIPDYTQYGMFSKIAKQFNINRSHVCRIYYGEKWWWISKDSFDFDIIKNKYQTNGIR